jgi:hypothetical protein
MVVIMVYKHCKPTYNCGGGHPVSVMIIAIIWMVVDIIHFTALTAGFKANRKLSRKW